MFKMDVISLEGTKICCCWSKSHVSAGRFSSWVAAHFGTSSHPVDRGSRIELSPGPWNRHRLDGKKESKDIFDNRGSAHDPKSRCGLGTAIRAKPAAGRRRPENQGSTQATFPGHDHGVDTRGCRTTNATRRTLDCMLNAIRSTGEPSRARVKRCQMSVLAFETSTAAFNSLSSSALTPRSGT